MDKFSFMGPDGLYKDYYGSSEAQSALLSWYVDYTKTDDFSVIEQLTENIALAEMVLRDKRLGALKFDVKINDDFLERYVGDGILVATSFGSTAQNKSYGGSIVYNELSSLQITPIAPISSKVFRSISNSIIVPSGYDIRFIPFTDRKDMIVTIDGNINDKPMTRLATEEEKKTLFDVIEAKGYKWNSETKTLEKLNKNKFDIANLKPFDKFVH